MLTSLFTTFLTFLFLIVLIYLSVKFFPLLYRLLSLYIKKIEQELNNIHHS